MAASSGTSTIVIDNVSYTWNSTSFIKSGLGNPDIRPWYRDRLYNEAAALELISARTTIPVPKLKSIRTSDDGIPSLEMERIYGVTCDEAGDECRMGHEAGHAISGPCATCQNIAIANAHRFITHIVLPQLQQLKSNTTGLNGFVIPSVWVLNHDRRKIWKSKSSTEQEFVFCHGDLVTHNIMCDPQTLEVTYLIDWEHAGYFPAECQSWALNREEYNKLFEDVDRLDYIISLLEPQEES